MLLFLRSACYGVLVVEEFKNQINAGSADEFYCDFYFVCDLCADALFSFCVAHF